MPKKRSNGEGALRKRQNGLWECMIMTGFQPNGKRKYKSFYDRIFPEPPFVLHPAFPPELYRYAFFFALCFE